MTTKLYREECRIPFGAWITNRDDPGSYSPNGWLCNPPPRTSQVYGRGLTEYYWRTVNINSTSNIPMFADCAWDDAWPRENDVPPLYDGEVIQQPNRDEMKHFCINRHNGFINSVFLDSSARKIGLKELWILKWHRNFNINGSWTLAMGMTPEKWAE